MNAYKWIRAEEASTVAFIHLGAVRINVTTIQMRFTIHPSGIVPIRYRNINVIRAKMLGM